MFHGVFTALSTPFLPDGKLDIPNLLKLLRAQLQAGVQGIVLLGTTAETPTLTPVEKKMILDVCVPEIKKVGRKLIIGAGTNSTVSTLENIRQVAAYQPDAVLVVTPYYNKPNTSGLMGHYKAAASVGIPLIMYHIPGRTGLKVPAKTLAELLVQVPQIIGLKECNCDMGEVTDTAFKYSGKLSYLCGNDDLFLQFLSIGACGTISAAACVLAPAFVKTYQAFEAGQTKQACELFSRIYPLVKACYLETNPTCIKYMLGKLGFGTDVVRLPLGPLSNENKSSIDTLLMQTPKEFLI